MQEPVVVRYRMEEWEYLRACNAHWAAHGAGAVSNVVVGGIGLLMGALQLRRPPLIECDPWIAWVAISVGVILIASTVALWWSYRRTYRSQKRFQGEIVASFFDDRVHLETVEGASDLPWSSFTRHLNARDHVLLYASKNSIVAVVPKRAFADDDKVDQFLDLVRSKLKKTGCRPI